MTWTGSYFDEFCDVSILQGKTLSRCERANEDGDDAIIFEVDTGEAFKLYHSQDCCESVNIEDVTGDLSDLVGSPITMAEQVDDENPGPPSEYDESYTWSFYKFATIKGYVTVRWLGTSNGYYSESVDFRRVKGATQ